MDQKTRAKHMAIIKKMVMERREREDVIRLPREEMKTLKPSDWEFETLSPCEKQRIIESKTDKHSSVTQNQLAAAKPCSTLQRTKNGVKFVLRILAAVVVPLVAFNLTERLPLIYPLCPICTYNGEDVLGMIGAGFVAGTVFVGLSYAIMPRWKLQFAIVASSIMTALLIITMVIVCAVLRSGAINWVHWAQNIAAIIGLCASMIGIHYEDYRRR